MKKFRTSLCIVIALFVYINLFGQDPPPEDGSGNYLDETEIPIDGNVYYVIAAIGVGSFMLLRKKIQTSNYNQKK